MLYEIAIKMQDQQDMMKGSAIRSEVYHQVCAGYGSPTRIDTSANTKMLYSRVYRYWYGKDVTLEQEWPWGQAALHYSNNPYVPNEFVADTWHFISNALASKRRLELNTNQGL